MTDLTTPFATRLCLSGAESRRLLDTFKQFGVNHVQLSYYYVQRVFSDPLEFQEYVKDFKTVILDSGTIFHRTKTADEKAEFLQEYAQYVAALDKRTLTAAVYEEGTKLDQILPDEAVIYPLDNALRELFDNDLTSLFTNLKYVGVSNKEASAKGGENLAPIFAAASRAGAYIHAFGTSSRKLLTKYPFYSANSSSWRSGSRYLNTYIYEGPSRGHRLYQPTDKKDLLKTEREIRNIRKRQENMVKIKQPNIYPFIEWEQMHDGDSWEVDKGNLSQWLLYIRDLELLGQNKYFLTDAQKTDLILRKRDIYAARNINGGANNSDRGDNTNPRISSSDISTPADTTSDDMRGDNSAVHPNDRNVVPSKSDIEAYIKKAVDMEEGIDGRPAGDTNGDTDSNSSNDSTSNSNEHPVEKGGSIEGGDIVDAEIVPDVEESNNIPTSTTGGIGDKPQSHADIVPYTAPQPRLRPIDSRLGVLRECDFCSLAGRCPKYVDGGKCAFGLSPENPTYDVENIQGHINEDLADLLAVQKDRIMHAAMEEKLDASGLSRDLGKEIERYAQIVALIAEAKDQRDSIEIKAKGTGVMDMFKKRNS